MKFTGLDIKKVKNIIEENVLRQTEYFSGLQTGIELGISQTFKKILKKNISKGYYS